LTDLTRSLIRFLTPIAVGIGTSALAHIGISQPAVVASLGTAVTIIYGSALRVLEQHYPKWGKLLGSVGAPTYPTSTSSTPATVATPPQR
jgi:hypothetical protein